MYSPFQSIDMYTFMPKVEVPITQLHGLSIQKIAHPTGKQCLPISITHKDIKKQFLI